MTSAADNDPNAFGAPVAATPQTPPASPSVSSSQASGAAAPSAPGDSAGSPPSADQMLSKMLQPTPGEAGTTPLQPIPAPPTVDTTSGAGAVAPGAPAVNVIREGSFIIDRTGRLTRSADGQQMEFTFDGDGQAMKDPPLVILPNLKLMAMENAVTNGNADLRFRVTGMVTEYRGRNYILLDKVVVVPDVEQQF
jgi:hypothetical protein